MPQPATQNRRISASQAFMLYHQWKCARATSVSPWPSDFSIYDMNPSGVRRDSSPQCGQNAALKRAAVAANGLASRAAVMRIGDCMRTCLAAAALLLASLSSVSAAGYAVRGVPDPGAPEITVEVWYPTAKRPRLVIVNPYTETRVEDARQAPGRHKLIVLSVGSIGWPDQFHDLGEALADAGFVVAGVSHPSDSSVDSSSGGSFRNIVDRPRHIKRVLDDMLRHWRGLDRRRVGLFGFGLGGIDVLTLAGAEPDAARLVRRCRDFPDSPECLYVRKQGGDLLM